MFARQWPADMELFFKKVCSFSNSCHAHAFKQDHACSPPSTEQKRGRNRNGWNTIICADGTAVSSTNRTQEAAVAVVQILMNIDRKCNEHVWKFSLFRGTLQVYKMMETAVFKSFLLSGTQTAAVVLKSSRHKTFHRFQLKLCKRGLKQSEGLNNGCFFLLFVFLFVSKCFIFNHPKISASIESCRGNFANDVNFAHRYHSFCARYIIHTCCFFVVVVFGFVGIFMLWEKTFYFLTHHRLWNILQIQCCVPHTSVYFIQKIVWLVLHLFSRSFVRVDVKDGSVQRVKCLILSTDVKKTTFICKFKPLTV